MRVILILTAVAVVSAPALAQQHDRGQAHPAQPHAERGAPHEVGGGHVPQRGPAPGEQSRGAQPPQRSGDHAVSRVYRDQPNHPDAPHVHAQNDEWVGHNGGHYHLAQPWAHGHFAWPIGPSHVFRLHGGARTRFEIDGGWFDVAPDDYPFVTGWLWNADDIVLYPDPDDDGYYLAYNVRLGTYAHVVYLGG